MFGVFYKCWIKFVRKQSKLHCYTKILKNQTWEYVFIVLLGYVTCYIKFNVIYSCFKTLYKLS